jgi:hypothetical protein
MLMTVGSHCIYSCGNDTAIFADPMILVLLLYRSRQIAAFHYQTVVTTGSHPIRLADPIATTSDLEYCHQSCSN